MNRDKVVVTGGMGFIGRNICELLLSEGYEVHIIDNYCTTDLKGINNYKYKIYKDHSEYLLNNLEDQNDGVIFHRMTILNMKRIPEVMKDAKYVFHTAAVPRVEPSIQNPLESNSINIQGSLAIFFAAKEAGVERIIFSSSSSVYGANPQLPKVETMRTEPLSPYAVAKLAAENYCSVYHRLYGLETVSLRYFNVFGPRQDPNSPYSGVVSRFIDAIKNEKQPTIYGDGEQTRDFTYVDNVAQANFVACHEDKAAGGVYNIGCQVRVSINELWHQMVEFSGSNLTAVYGPHRAGDVPHSLADISAARRDLNFDPQVGVGQGLKSTLKFYL